MCSRRFEPWRRRKQGPNPGHGSGLYYAQNGKLSSSIPCLKNNVLLHPISSRRRRRRRRPPLAPFFAAMFSSLRSLTKPARSLTSSYSSSSLLRHPHVAGRPASSVQRLGGGRSSFSHSWSYYTLGALANQSSAGAGMTKRTGVLLARFNLAALRGNGGWGRGNLLRRTGLASRSWLLLIAYLFFFFFELYEGGVVCKN